MEVEQIVIHNKTKKIGTFSFVPDLIIVFISNSFKDTELIKDFKTKYPTSIFFGSTAVGEIEDISVHNDSIVLTGVSFDSSYVVYNEINISSDKSVVSSGSDLINKFESKGLKHIFVLADGLNINGSDLVEGLQYGNGEKFSVTGGFAGGEKDHNFVVTNELLFKKNIVIALGFYGDDLKVGFGALNGWNSLGVDRIITKSKKNIVYEIDGEPAIELYRKLLGTTDVKTMAVYSQPLSFRENTIDSPIIRTVISINEDGSLVFRGDMKEGSLVRVMKSNIDRLINAAEGAAEVSIDRIGNTHADLSILVSCFCRKNLLKELISEEIEAVREVVGEDAMITGFYSYGEISPFVFEKRCKLHTQTMSVTTFSESSLLGE